MATAGQEQRRSSHSQQLTAGFLRSGRGTQSAIVFAELDSDVLLRDQGDTNATNQGFFSH